MRIEIELDDWAEAALDDLARRSGAPPPAAARTLLERDLRDYVRDTADRLVQPGPSGPLPERIEHRLYRMFL